MKQKPQWKRCPEPEAPPEILCATIQVPLDYRKPGGKRIEVAISRIKATGTGKRRGVLLSNPGGPGGPGLYLPLGMAQWLPAAAREKYDLIGFDPRGVGSSTPVTCGLKPEEDWLRPYKPETFDDDVAWARTVARKCEQKAGAVSAHHDPQHRTRHGPDPGGPRREEAQLPGVLVRDLPGSRLHPALSPGAPTGSSWTARSTRNKPGAG